MAGYILEEVLARLIRRNGYRLLESEADDPEALRDGSHGLLVRGRGAEHQVDVLGDLLSPTPFTFPTRLFVEAKFRNSPIDLPTVRNAHGVVYDVNEYYRSDGGRLTARHYLSRFHYRYALFSVSGFTAPAQKFALAHHISLIDLSGQAFDHLRDAVRGAADYLRKSAEASRLRSFPTRSVRSAIRESLGASGEASGRHDFAGLDSNLVLDVASCLARNLDAGPSGEGLLLGFTRSPFILAMLPAGIEELAEAVADRHTIEVKTNFNRHGHRKGAAGEWVLYDDRSPGVRLTLGLPGILESWLLTDKSQRADDHLSNTLTDVTFFLEDHMVRLVPTSNEPRTPDFEVEVPTHAGAPSELRAKRRIDLVWSDATVELPPTYDDPKTAPGAPLGTWTTQAVTELLRRLEGSHPAQFDVLRTAAANGGAIDRAAVYRLADYPPSRSLRGFTRPTRRISADLVREGYLPSTAPDPLRAEYESGVRATHFVVAPEILRILMTLPPPLGPVL
ncbi:hypothetical protein [Nocardioides sp. NPDC004968]|uniref:hypothetical protein n=1 Tax=Nocardioides sp. NPDC004968 TaxID=3155894 RepID=UPI0033A4EEF0